MVEGDVGIPTRGSRQVQEAVLQIIDTRPVDEIAADEIGEDEIAKKWLRSHEIPQIIGETWTPEGKVAELSLAVAFADELEDSGRLNKLLREWTAIERVVYRELEMRSRTRKETFDSFVAILEGCLNVSRNNVLGMPLCEAVRVLENGKPAGETQAQSHTAGEPERPPEDPTAYRPASELCPDKGIPLKRAREFCTKHSIRHRNPNQKRLEIHAGDWTEYWARKDADGFNALDQGDGKRSVFGTDDIVVGSAAERFKRLQTKKRARE